MIGGTTRDSISAKVLKTDLDQAHFLIGAATLTSTKVDLLPHQVVIVHRVANSRPHFEVYSR